MTDIIPTVVALAAYPGVEMSPTAATNQFVVDMTNGLIEDLIGDIDPVPWRVRAIAFEVAARALRNPQNFQQRTVQIDDYKETVVLRGDGGAEKPNTGVFLSGDEMRRLLRAAGVTVSRIKSIRLSVPGYPHDSYAV